MLDNLPVINEIKTAINKADKLLLISHQKPDGDALGCLSAMAGFLKQLQKNYKIFCPDPAPEQYQFLPYIHELTADKKVFEEKFDIIIVMDASALKYAGVQDFVSKDNGYVLINIDHHFTNDYFGHVNLVLPEKSSVSEIIFELLKMWQIKISKEIATALLNGIIFDTSALSNPATSYGALKAASSLMAYGARFGEIKDNLLKNKTVDLLKVWGIAFQRLRVNPKYQFAFTVLTRSDLKDSGVDDEATTGLINFFNELTGVKAVMLLVEQADGGIKASLRTTRDNVDVSKIAKQCGGGGHQKAAGFTFQGKLVYNENKWQIV